MLPCEPTPLIRAAVNQTGIDIFLQLFAAIKIQHVAYLGDLQNCQRLILTENCNCLRANKERKLRN